MNNNTTFKLFCKYKKITLFFLFIMYLQVGIILNNKYVLGKEIFVCNNDLEKCVDDIYCGALKNPCCSIEYALKKSGKNDILLIKKGTYHENWHIKNVNGATKKRPITITSYLDQTVKISGKGIDKGRIKFEKCSNIIIIGIEICNFNQGVHIENCKNIQLKNITIHDIGQEALKLFNNSIHCAVINCKIFDTGLWKWNGEGIYVGSGSRGNKDNTNNILIKGNKIFDTSDEGIELKPGTFNVTVDKNILMRNRKFAAIEICQHANGNQYYHKNPNHLIINNIIREINSKDCLCAIRAGTGCIVYNNIIYNLGKENYGICIDMRAPDMWKRKIYHNTIDVEAEKAINYINGRADIKNNIGVDLKHNIILSPIFFRDKNRHDYRLNSEVSPIDTGVDLTNTVRKDFNGNPRYLDKAPDLGAFEYQK